jgi:ribosome-associated translation inhibitor RaiA
MDSSPALEQFAHRWASRLDNVHDRISRGEVVIERPHQRQHQGQRIRVRVTLSIPGPDIVVSHDREHDGSHEDAYVAVRDAFRIARRRLVEQLRRDRPTLADVLAQDEGAAP